MRALAGWRPDDRARGETPFFPARVILQDFTGVPCVVDLAAMRDAMDDLGGDPDRAPERSRILTALLTSPLLDLVRRRAWGEVDILLGRIAGRGVTLERLGIVPEGAA